MAVSWAQISLSHYCLYLNYSRRHNRKFEWMVRGLRARCGGCRSWFKCVCGKCRRLVRPHFDLPFNVPGSTIDSVAPPSLHTRPHPQRITHVREKVVPRVPRARGKWHMGRKESRPPLRDTGPGLQGVLTGAANHTAAAPKGASDLGTAPVQLTSTQSKGRGPGVRRPEVSP